MSYRVNREKKLSDDAENNTAVAFAGSNSLRQIELVEFTQDRCARTVSRCSMRTNKCSRRT